MPPFPWVKTADRSLVLGRATDDEDASAVIAALRRERVGGQFWGRPMARRAIVVRTEPDDERGWGDQPTRTALLTTRPPTRQESATLRACSVALVPPSTNWWSLMINAEFVRCSADDELGLIAWLCGVPVCNLDYETVPAPTIEAALRANLAGWHYRNAFTGEPASIGEVVEQLGVWRRLLDDNRAIGAVAGISRWKRTQLAKFLWDGIESPPMRREGAALTIAKRRGSSLGIWPSRVSARLLEVAIAEACPVATIEDGFIRSIGLGSNLTVPWSLVVDRRGIYFDPSRPSDLETLLATHVFTEAELARAAALRHAVVAGRVGKYSARDATSSSLILPADRRSVLVVGQVGDDLSVLKGGNGIGGNLPLLHRVRAEEPNAFIVYRPHPDVEAGHRTGALRDAVVLSYADAIDRAGNVLAMIERVDAVHVLSSLTGFEALLRGREVIVHGQPFYAGWGLTHDLAPQSARRGRPLTINALIAASLILYPRYLDPVTGLPCSPEILIERLTREGPVKNSILIRMRRWQGRLHSGWTRAKDGR